MTQTEIAKILDLHAKWRNNEEGGQRAYLSDADLSDADLIGADLIGADLSGADLSGAYLSVADLSGADLSGANLSGADLSGADLSGADLSGAYLSVADLSVADLSGADLSGAKGHFCFGPMPTSGRIVHCSWHRESGWMVKAGCFWGNLYQLEAKVKSDHKCPVYLGMIAFLRTYNQAK